MIEDEVRIWTRVRHPGVVRLFGVYEAPKLYALVNELCDGGCLFERLQKVENLTERHARRISVQVIEAVAHLHGMGIVHRDIKPDNILCTDRAPHVRGRVKLGDFGFAAEYDTRIGAQLTRLLGTPEYSAPEIVAEAVARNKGLKKADKSYSYCEKIDLWSLGCVVYELLAGEPPFWHPDIEENYELTLHSPLKFPDKYFSAVSPAALQLIGELLVRDPQARLGAASVRSCAWLQGYVFDEAASRRGSAGSVTSAAPAAAPPAPPPQPTPLTEAASDPPKKSAELDGDAPTAPQAAPVDDDKPAEVAHSVLQRAGALDQEGAGDDRAPAVMEEVRAAAVAVAAAALGGAPLDAAQPEPKAADGPILTHRAGVAQRMMEAAAAAGRRRGPRFRLPRRLSFAVRRGSFSAPSGTDSPGNSFTASPCRSRRGSSSRQPESPANSFTSPSRQRRASFSKASDFSFVRGRRGSDATYFDGPADAAAGAGSFRERAPSGKSTGTGSFRSGRSGDSPCDIKRSIFTEAPSSPSPQGQPPVRRANGASGGLDAPLAKLAGK